MMYRIIKNCSQISRFYVNTRKMSSINKVSVKISQGTVVGNEYGLTDGNSYYAFKGIPYAVAPLKELKFKSPVPLEKFKEPILDCSNEGDRSFHRDPFTSDIVGSEDCLFLNVYTPKLKSEKPLPVMVWIHGGAFTFGSGNSDFHLPLNLIQEDVIVVTLNYRLGMFGFLYLPGGDVYGNAGLKDQLLALKWIKQNIRKFNGDADNVTLFGHSAGGASVHLHLLSPNSKKYFHKAICQSGTANMEWVMQKFPEQKARKLAELAGCKSKDDKEIIEYLRNQNESINIYKHLLNTLNDDERRRGLPIPFKPVIEPKSDDAILTKAPLDIMLESNTLDKPVMMGYTSSEGITMLVNAVRKLDVLDNDLARMIPRSLDLEPDNPLCAEVAKKIRDFYFQGQPLTKKNFSALCDLMTDYHFAIGMRLAAELHAHKQHNSPLYFYRFSYNGNMNLFKKWFNFQKLKGACHGDELFYLFQLEQIDEKPEPGSKDEQLTKTMCKMWTNFAKYGNPTPNEDNTLNFKWNPVKHVNTIENHVLDYLEIDNEISMEKNPDEERVQFWKRMFRKYNGSFFKPKL